MDLDIQFGDLEEAQPEAHLRPDRNKHFAVAPYESPEERDLPIFVDFDVMRDIEAHAVSDTSVELGGVLLGGQFQDEDGRPFVMVTDSLRANHFEATKGSFKFTHDTWEQISRERDEFPADLQMVGWYHTHPDWGVFLSSMDMFICDNFFNRPLDLALVVDPCRQDRGMFQWTGEPRERIRRTGGFYLTTSRFRQQELEFFLAQLEGKMTMTTTDPRFGAYPMQVTSPAPVINIAAPKNTWQGPAIAGMLTTQFLLLALLAWRLLAPMAAVAEEKKNESKEPTVAEQIDELQRSLTRKMSDEQRTTAQIDAQRQLMQALVAELKGEDGRIVKDYEAKQERISELTSNLAGQQALVTQLKITEKTLSEERDKLDRDLAAKTSSYEYVKNEMSALAKKHADAKATLSSQSKKIVDFEKQINGDMPAVGSMWLWIWIGLAAVGGAALGAVTVGAVVRKPPEEHLDDERDDDPYGREAAPQADAAAEDGQPTPAVDDSETPRPE